ISATLRDRLPEPVELYVESIDAPQTPSGTMADADLLSFYRAKYAKTKPDLVLALAEPTLAFIERHRSEFFPQVPVVFGFVDERMLEERTLAANVTGVFQPVDVRRTLEIALRFHPNTRTVVIVGGTAPLDRALESVARQDAREFEPRVAFRY